MCVRKKEISRKGGRSPRSVRARRWWVDHHQNEKKIAVGFHLWKWIFSIFKSLEISLTSPMPRPELIELGFVVGVRLLMKKTVEIFWRMFITWTMMLGWWIQLYGVTGMGMSSGTRHSSLFALWHGDTLCRPSTTTNHFHWFLPVDSSNPSTVLAGLWTRNDPSDWLFTSFFVFYSPFSGKIEGGCASSALFSHSTDRN